MAGTGKSTIARTIARTFEEQGRLGASFFFSNNRGDCSHAAKFFPTIVWQLADAIPALKSHMLEAIVKRKGVTRRGLRDQWTHLIYQPLVKLGNNQAQPQSFAIVIDALDECQGDDDVRAILESFTTVRDLGNLRLSIFITSRPEVHIRTGFRNMPEILHHDLILDEIPKHVIERDILAFLKHEMNKIQKDLEQREDWPSQQCIKTLAEQANGLFIYATTVCRFVGDPHDRDGPEELLNLVLDGKIVGRSPTTTLDEIYTRVLKSSIRKGSGEDDRKKLRDSFRYIVGSIIVSFDMLTTHALAKLLFISKSKVDATLRFLRSLLNIPQDHNAPIQLLHPSFHDFLLDSKRCRDDHFLINQEIVHINLAENCLRLLSDTLKKDICNLETPGTLAYEVQGNTIDSHLPRHVQYACCYWVDHLDCINPVRRKEIGLHDTGKVHAFLEKHFLHWLEALSLIGKVSEGVLMIIKLESMIKVCGLILPRCETIADLLDIRIKILPCVLWFMMQSDMFFKTGQ
jgi:hypothetical protein